VFGPGGPLDLKVGDRQIQLTRALDGAIARRDSLQGDPRAEPRAIAAAEAEIRRLRKEFREGTQLQAGDVLGRGRYRLEERIGQGGFAGVWRATDLRDQSSVAIKVLHGQFAEDKSRRERFFRGAWKMSELQHPAIVRVLEPYGDENGQFYFVMEYLAGGTLHAAVQDHAGDPGGRAQDAGAGRPGAALRPRARPVHRDVKPSNVMIDGERGKLTDFDLVRETDITAAPAPARWGRSFMPRPR
jgi:serine/threonine protein kinase